MTFFNTIGLSSVWSLIYCTLLLLSIRFLLQSSKLPTREKNFLFSLFRSSSITVLMLMVSILLSKVFPQNSFVDLSFFIHCINVVFTIYVVILIFINPIRIIKFFNNNQIFKKVLYITLSIITISIIRVLFSKDKLGTLFEIAYLFIILMPYLALWPVLLLTKLEKNRLLKYFLRIHICLGFITSLVFLGDCLGPQGEMGPGIIILPFLLPAISMGSLIAYLAYITTFFVVLKLLHKLFKLKVLYALCSLTLLSCLYFQYIWWTDYYTPVSIPRRVYGWNIITAVFPWLAVVFAIIIAKYKEKIIFKAKCTMVNGGV